MTVFVPPPAGFLPGAPISSALSFSGSPREFFRLVLRGAVLLIPTFGFYRFWLITDLRRHLWANTRVGDEALEYTGTPRELLIGFLVALAILAPFYVAYLVLGLVAESAKAFASTPLLLAGYAFGRYAAFRSRRYRLSRTLFRGVRFWMTGSAWVYARKAILWDAFAVLTLGLAYPWRASALERYKMQNTSFGDLPGAFVGTGGGLFRQGWAMWVITLLIPLVVTLGLVRSRSFGIAILSMTVALPICFVMLQAIEMRWRLESIRFGAVAFGTDLTRRAVLACYAKLAAALFGCALVFLAAVAAIFYGFRMQAAPLTLGSTGPSATLVAAFGLAGCAYLVFLIGCGVAKRRFLDRGLWVAAVRSLTIVNMVELDRVAGSGVPASAVGEGLADALDVGAF